MSSLKELPEETALGSILINIRKLAACLCMADICNADARRAPSIVFNYLEMNEESALHWKRHLQISGITRKNDRLIVSAIYFSEEGRNAINDYKNEIEKQLKIVKPYFNSYLSHITEVDLQAKKLNSPLDVTLRFQAISKYKIALELI